MATSVDQLSSPYQPEILGMERQRKLAELLIAQGQQQPQGQMVGNRFVPVAPTQHLANLANTALGSYAMYDADQKALDLAKRIREGENMAMADYISQLKGTPATPDVSVQPTLAGKPMRDDETGALYPPIVTKGKPAVAGNPFLANLNAAQDERLPAWMRQHAMKEVTKGPDWKEFSQYNKQTGETETWRYDNNAQNPKDTLQFLGTSKPALTLNERLHLQDKGIAIPANVGGGTPSVPTGGAPAVTGGSLTSPAPAGVTKPLTVKPVAGTNAKEPDLVAAFGYDPFKPPPVPAGMPSGEAARAYRADQYKALEGEGGKKVNGAAAYQDALDKYLKVLDSVDLSDLANPQARKRIDSAYNTAILAGKNAYDLGVLNGGDERILNSLVPNYKDATELLTFKDTIKELVQGQKEYGTGVILKEYARANKPVPELYRKHIVVPKVETGASNKQTSVEPMYATNPTTKERRVSYDGGNTWQPVKAK